MSNESIKPPTTTNNSLTPELNYQKYDGYQRGLASMVYKFFDKKSKGSGITNEFNYQLANELHKPIIRKF